MIQLTLEKIIYLVFLGVVFYWQMLDADCLLENEMVLSDLIRQEKWVAL